MAKAGDALRFVEENGIVLQSARGTVPSLAEHVAGERIRGSWWGHARGREIYQAAEAVIASGDVLVCRLVDDKVTYVHRRLWPALVHLASRFPRARLAKVWSEHTASGRHRAHRMPFPSWVPPEVSAAASRLNDAEAEAQLAPWLHLARRPSRVRASGRRRRRS